MDATKKWTWKDTVVLFILPVELTVGALLNVLGLTKNQLLATVLVFLIFFTGFLTAVILKRDLLAEDFRKYKQHFFKNFGLSILGAIIFGGIILGGRGLFQTNQAFSQIDFTASASLSTVVPIAISGIIPLMAPFVEETVFRYELFYRWKDTKWVKIAMLIVSSVLFGLAHYKNYSSVPILMLPMMLAGAALAGLYYWRGNIWISLFAHFIYNAAFSFFPTILLIFIQLAGGK
ncbi:CPBP family intramembrane glutamic endopeptidase [Enterococcus raffinosus]|uniref:CPBP family intramembrane glutamic endopeptidase n=1 Tax=Enterococcus raffinosus TaxID=71452 RepID=UPI001C974833|nr:type II CAAX endopeptidase family protein [Enterococcus raffinosus]QZO07866.1 CPBP family intramembrane metalloprotease [Enterococcus raffinosus]